MKFDVPSVVIDKLFNNGYEEQIVDFVMACEDKEGLEVSDIPISPTLMGDSGDKVIISPKVYETYMQFVNRISNPQTAQEIPFILLGNRREINGETYVVIEDVVYDMQRAKSETHVTDDEETLSSIIHEMCHAIKGYGKLKVENGQVITSSGLIKDYYEYDRETNSFTNTKSDNTGLEEALNSYDEASIMTIMTGKFHEFGAYKGMTQVARELMKHEELAQIIRTSQFSGGTEWKDFLGKEESEYLSKNFEDWVSVLYSSPSELMNDKLGLMEKMKTAMNNVADYAKNYTSPQEIQAFMESRKLADQKTVDIVKQIIYYNSQTNSFEQTQEKTGRTL